MPTFSEKDLEEILKRGHVKIHSGSSVQTPNVEPSIIRKPVEEKRNPRFASPVNIRVHSIRKRLADPDGISVKAVLDSIVKAGILEDDSAQYIKEVRFTQEKAKGRKEKTIITIED